MTKAQFETLLDQYGNSIFGFCYHLTGNKANAEDLYQDAVMKAFSKLEMLDCEASGGFINAKNYIIGIAARLHKNILRRKDYKNSLYFTDSESLISGIGDNIDIVTETEQKDIRAATRQIVQNLPEKLRIVILMFYYADISVNDISDQLHIPLGTIKSRLNRARAQIKKELEDRNYG